MYENTWLAQREFDQVGYNLVYEVSPETEAEFFRLVRELGELFLASKSDAADRRLVSLTMLVHRVPDSVKPDD